VRCTGHAQALGVTTRLARQRFRHTQHARAFDRGGRQRGEAGARQFETAEQQIAQTTDRRRHLFADRGLARLRRGPAGAFVVGVAHRVPDASETGHAGAFADRVDLG